MTNYETAKLAIARTRELFQVLRTTEFDLKCEGLVLSLRSYLLEGKEFWTATARLGASEYFSVNRAASADAALEALSSKLET